MILQEYRIRLHAVDMCVCRGVGSGGGVLGRGG